MLSKITGVTLFQENAALHWSLRPSISSELIRAPWIMKRVNMKGKTGFAASRPLSLLPCHHLRGKRLSCSWAAGINPLLLKIKARSYTDGRTDGRTTDGLLHSCFVRTKSFCGRCEDFPNRWFWFCIGICDRSYIGVSFLCTGIGFLNLVPA